MHSSRMRTARVLTVSPSLLCAGGVSAPRGVSVPRGVSAPGGVSALGVSIPRVGGWCLLPRGSAPWGGGIPACTEADTPIPPVNRMTDACKKHNLAPTSLWAVTRMHSSGMGTALFCGSGGMV